MVDRTLPTRRFSFVDFRRGAINFVCLLAILGTWYCVLPAIQDAILPAAPGGSNGPWVIRPIGAMRYGAAVILSTATVMVIMRYLRRIWDAEDAALGSRYDFFHQRSDQKIGFMIRSVLLGLIYAAGLPIYLYSWTVVGPEGIDVHQPWGRRSYGFDQVTYLAALPDGMRSDKLGKSGPWHEVMFLDNRKWSFGEGNEGCSADEVSAIARYIATRSGREWRQPLDAKRPARR